MAFLICPGIIGLGIIVGLVIVGLIVSFTLMKLEDFKAKKAERKIYQRTPKDGLRYKAKAPEPRKELIQEEA